MSRDTRDRRRKEVNVPGHAHEFTFSCYQRFQFLKAERTCQWPADAIANARISGKTLLKMIDYLHNNPVRRGLVQRARDWKWSSAAWFEGGFSPISLDPIPWEWLADA
jgi:hypothetical protein